VLYVNSGASLTAVAAAIPTIGAIFHILPDHRILIILASNRPYRPDVLELVD